MAVFSLSEIQPLHTASLLLVITGIELYLRPGRYRYVTAKVLQIANLHALPLNIPKFQVIPFKQIYERNKYMVNIQ